MPACVIFDLDNTLIGTPGMTATWLKTLTSVGVNRELAHDAWASSRGLSLWSQIEKCGISDPELQQQLVEHFWSDVRALSPRTLPGADQLIRELSAGGARLYLSTGSAGEIAIEVMERFEWETHFELILGSDPGNLKGEPHYALIRADAEAAGYDLRESGWAIGDGQLDMQYALAEGIPHRVGVAHPGQPANASELLEAGATMVVSELGGLAELILGRS